MIVIAGANGSGKTTLSKELIEKTGYIFLNADEIQRERNVSPIQAGKIFFSNLELCFRQNKSFILESTLSGGYLAGVLKSAKLQSYLITLVYLFLESPQDCINRIKLRVKLGGHYVPDEDVIRRYYRSKKNFWRLYKNMADNWVLLYNSDDKEPQRVAIGVGEDYIVESEYLFNVFTGDTEL